LSNRMNLFQQFENFCQEDAIDRPGFCTQAYNTQKAELFLELISKVEPDIGQVDDFFCEEPANTQDAYMKAPVIIESQVQMPSCLADHMAPKPINLDVSKLSKALKSSSGNSTTTRRAHTLLGESVDELSLDKSGEMLQTIAVLESGRGKMRGIEFITRQRRQLQQLVCGEAKDKFHALGVALKMPMSPGQLGQMVEKSEYEANQHQQKLRIAIERRAQSSLESTEPERANVASRAVAKQLEKEVDLFKGYVDAEEKVKEKMTKLTDRLEQVLEKTREPYIQATSVILDFGDEMLTMTQWAKEITKHVAQSSADHQMEEYMARDDKLKTVFDIEDTFGLVKKKTIKRAIQQAVEFNPRRPFASANVASLPSQVSIPSGYFDGHAEVEKITKRDYSGNELIIRALITDVYAQIQH